jgi:hypothetical protein
MNDVHAYEMQVQIWEPNTWGVTQAASEREVIATVAAEINPEELKILAKKPSILSPPKEADMKQIDLDTSHPSKMATISAHLSAKKGTHAHQISLGQQKYLRYHVS